MELTFYEAIHDAQKGRLDLSETKLCNNQLALVRELQGSCQFHAFRRDHVEHAQNS